MAHKNYVLCAKTIPCVDCGIVKSTTKIIMGWMCDDCIKKRLKLLIEKLDIKSSRVGK